MSSAYVKRQNQRSGTDKGKYLYGTTQRTVSDTLYDLLACFIFISTIKPPSIRRPNPPPPFLSPKTYLKVAAHVSPDSRVVQETLNAANSTNSDVLVPYFAVGEVHDFLLGDLVDNTFNLTGVHPTTGGDELAADVLGDGGCAIEGQENGGLQLGLGALDLGLGNITREAGPLTEGEVDKIVDAGELVGDEVDAPETYSCQQEWGNYSWIITYPVSL